MDHVQWLCVCADVHVGLEMGRLIQQARLQQSMSQKDLAAVGGLCTLSSGVFNPFSLLPSLSLPPSLPPSLSLPPCRRSMRRWLWWWTMSLAVLCPILRSYPNWSGHLVGVVRLCVVLPCCSVAAVIAVCPRPLLKICLSLCDFSAFPQLDHCVCRCSPHAVPHPQLTLVPILSTAVLFAIAGVHLKGEKTGQPKMVGRGRGRLR